MLITGLQPYCRNSSSGKRELGLRPEALREVGLCL